MSGSIFCWSTKHTCIKIHMCSYSVVYLLLDRSLIVEHCSGSNGELPGFVYIYIYINNNEEKKNKKNQTHFVIFLDFHSTKQGLSLVDSWSRGLD